jgi:hypothetical protein
MTERPTPEQLKEIFDYDENAGVLIWKARSDDAAWSGHYAGKAAGSLGTRGYIAVRLGARAYYAHRIIWAWTHSAWPVDQIDHVNRVRTDNRIINLRHVTHTENTWNRSVNANNTSGLTGASFHKRTKKWTARIGVDGGRKHLGYFASAQEASAAYLAAKQVHHVIES